MTDNMKAIALLAFTFIVGAFCGFVGTANAAEPAGVAPPEVVMTVDDVTPSCLELAITNEQAFGDESNG